MLTTNVCHRLVGVSSAWNACKCLQHTKTQKNQEPLPTGVPFTVEEQQSLLITPPDCPADPKRLRVAVIGMPNAGKSTLINALTGSNLLPTSPKIDTTTRNSMTLLTVGNTQIEFTDSPGIRSKKNCKKIVGSYQQAKLPDMCMEEAHLSMVVVDLMHTVSRRGFLHAETLLHLLKHKQIPAILVLNKCDRIFKRINLLPLVESMTNGKLDGQPTGRAPDTKPAPISLPPVESDFVETFNNVETAVDIDEINTALRNERMVLNQLRECAGWSHFKDVFIVSALKGERLKQLQSYLLSKAVSEPWRYNSKVQTDQTPHELTLDAIRSTLLILINEEIPYHTKSSILDWRTDNGHLYVFIQMECQKPKHVHILERNGKALAFGIKNRISNMFRTEVDIDLVVELSE